MKHPFATTAAAIAFAFLLAAPAFGQSGGTIVGPKWSHEAAEITSNQEAPLHVTGSITPPRLIHSVPPKLPAQEKGKAFGVVRIYFWVEQNGRTSHVSVSKSVSVAMNDAAVKAVQQYRFQPSTLHGKPVKVDAFVDVQFY